MFSTALHVLDNPAVAESIVSDSCVSLMRPIPTLRRLSEDERKAYLVAATCNTARCHY